MNRISRVLRSRRRASELRERLLQAIEEDGRAPYRKQIALAEIKRFLADPLSYRSEEALCDPTGSGLAGRHVRCALKAQALSFADRPDESAAAMREALAQIGVPTRQRTSDERDQAEIYALGKCFLRAQALRSHRVWPADEPQAYSSAGIEPPMSFIEDQRARHLMWTGRYREAAAAFEWSRAINAQISPELDANFALDMTYNAILAAEAADTSGDLRAELLRRAEESLDAVPAKISNEVSASLSFWRGRLWLVKSIVAKAPLDGAKFAVRAHDSFLEVRETSGSEDAAKSWVPVARRQHAIHKLRLGDSSVAAEVLETEKDPAGPAFTAKDGALSWGVLEEGFCQSSSNLARDFIRTVLDVMTNTRGNVSPPSPAQRLVLEISDCLVGTEEARDLIGSDMNAGPETSGDGKLPSNEMPSISSLRRYFQRTYGIQLPGILIRNITGGENYPENYGSMILILDNDPVANRSNLIARNAHWKGGFKVSELFSKEELERIRDETPLTPNVLNSEHYAAWQTCRWLLNALHRLVDVTQIQQLGLGDVKPRFAFQMVRLLLADRTPLLERESLLRLARAAEAGVLSSIEAAEAYRRVPAIRSSLWGVREIESKWQSYSLSDKLEKRIAACVEDASVGIDLDIEIYKAIGAEIKEQLGAAAKDDLGSMAATPRSGKKSAVEASQSGASGVAEQSLIAGPHRRLVVQNPILRPWLREAIVGLEHQWPVITKAEKECSYNIDASAPT